jgi:hypothetical protein
MHGLIFETSVCYWQNQPGCYLCRATEVAWNTYDVTDDWTVKNNQKFFVSLFSHRWRLDKADCALKKRSFTLVDIPCNKRSSIHVNAFMPSLDSNPYFQVVWCVRLSSAYLKVELSVQHNRFVTSIFSSDEIRRENLWNNILVVIKLIRNNSELDSQWKFQMIW